MDISKHKGKPDDKARCWLTEFYPESMNPEFREIASLIGLQMCISPLHDKDVNPTGEFKKPHYHALLKWKNPTTRRNAEKYVKMMGGVGCFECVSESGSVQYWTHKNNPEKAQYNFEDIECIAGYDLETAYYSDSDDMLELKQMYAFIRENGFTMYSDFVDYCMEFEMNWFRLINKKYRENLWKYLRSREYKEQKEAMEIERCYYGEDKQGSAGSYEEVSEK